MSNHVYTAPTASPKIGELWKILGEMYLVVKILEPLPEDSIYSYRTLLVDPDGRVLECPIYFFDVLLCEAVTTKCDEA